MNDNQFITFMLPNANAITVNNYNKSCAHERNAIEQPSLPINTASSSTNNSPPPLQQQQHLAPKLPPPTEAAAAACTAAVAAVEQTIRKVIPTTMKRSMEILAADECPTEADVKDSWSDEVIPPKPAGKETVEHGNEKTKDIADRAIENPEHGNEKIKDLAGCAIENPEHGNEKIKDLAGCANENPEHGNEKTKDLANNFAADRAKEKDQDEIVATQSSTDFTQLSTDTTQSSSTASFISLGICDKPKSSGLDSSLHPRTTTVVASAKKYASLLRTTQGGVKLSYQGSIYYSKSGKPESWVVGKKARFVCSFDKCGSKIYILAPEVLRLDEFIEIFNFLPHTNEICKKKIAEEKKEESAFDDTEAE